MNAAVGIIELATRHNRDGTGCRAELDRLWRRGRQVLGCDLAIMGGAMTWVSERRSGST